MNYALSYPALNGDVVTQGHTDYCRDHGHATHKVDGVVQDRCPRCGELLGRYTLVTFHETASGKVRAKVRGRFDYDEDAHDAAREIAATEGTVVPNVDAPTKHRTYGELSHSIRLHGNALVHIYLNGYGQYRA